MTKRVWLWASGAPKIKNWTGKTDRIYKRLDKMYKATQSQFGSQKPGATHVGVQGKGFTTTILNPNPVVAEKPNVGIVYGGDRSSQSDQIIKEYAQDRGIKIKQVRPKYGEENNIEKRYDKVYEKYSPVAEISIGDEGKVSFGGEYHKYWTDKSFEIKTNLPKQKGVEKLYTRIVDEIEADPNRARQLAGKKYLERRDAQAKKPAGISSFISGENQARLEAIDAQDIKNVKSRHVDESVPVLERRDALPLPDQGEDFSLQSEHDPTTIESSSDFRVVKKLPPFVDLRSKSLSTPDDNPNVSFSPLGEKKKLVTDLSGVQKEKPVVKLKSKGTILPNNIQKIIKSPKIKKQLSSSMQQIATVDLEKEVISDKMGGKQLTVKNNPFSEFFQKQSQETQAKNYDVQDIDENKAQRKELRTLSAIQKLQEKGVSPKKIQNLLASRLTDVDRPSIGSTSDDVKNIPQNELTPKLKKQAIKTKIQEGAYGGEEKHGEMKHWKGSKFKNFLPKGITAFSIFSSLLSPAVGRKQAKDYTKKKDPSVMDTFKMMFPIMGKPKKKFGLNPGDA